MKHPSREDWMAYLYDEGTPESRTALRQHLAECAECAASVKHWETAMNALHGWQWPATARSASAMPAALRAWKWGVAALFALGLGYGLGQAAAPRAIAPEDSALIESTVRAAMMDSVRDQVRDEMREQMRAALASAQETLRQEFSTQMDEQFKRVAAQSVSAAGEQAKDFLAAYDAQRRREYDVWLAALERLDARQTRHATDLASFRRETETMAVLTEEGFRRAQRQMLHLANFSDADNPKNPGERTQPAH